MIVREQLIIVSRSRRGMTYRYNACTVIKMPFPSTSLQQLTLKCEQLNEAPSYWQEEKPLSSVSFITATL